MKTVGGLPFAVLAAALCVAAPACRESPNKPKEVTPMTDKEMQDETRWETCLTPQQYRVLRQKGTEPPFSGRYDNFHEKGVYRCAACGSELFRSDDKFDSGTGWPSYFQPIRPDAVRLVPDDSLGLHRIEVLCAHCGSHLGHVFDDGPPPTGKRFCINSVALKFEKKPGGNQ